jgi:hypothetical protein
MASRETAVAALFSRLTATSAFVAASRRNSKPENFTTLNTPALLLVEHSELYEQPNLGVPKRMIYLTGMIYVNVGNDQNKIPGTLMNNALDAIDAALTPGPAEMGRCTLGGLVYAVTIKGKVIRAPGEITGLSAAYFPVEIILP